MSRSVLDYLKDKSTGLDFNVPVRNTDPENQGFY
jgi:hypothetical protein